MSVLRVNKCSQLFSTVAAKSCGPLTWYPYKPSILSMHTHRCCVGGWVRWRCECRGWAGLLSHVRSPWSDRWSGGGHVSGHSLHWHHACSSSSVLPPLEMLGPGCCFSKQKHTEHSSLFLAFFLEARGCFYSIAVKLLWHTCHMYFWWTV